MATLQKAKKEISATNKKSKEKSHFSDISRLIDESKNLVVITPNSAFTLLYSKIGKAINTDILKNKSAAYGKLIVASLSRQLETAYGKGFDKKKHLKNN